MILHTISPKDSRISDEMDTFHFTTERNQLFQNSREEINALQPLFGVRVFSDTRQADV